MTELLPPLLQILSDQQLVAIPDSLDGQLRLLMNYLRERRVLLVLDNLESILEPQQAGAYRLGYEGYGQLIQQMATLDHQSHLLLTSRERPRGYHRLEGDSPLVQSLQLSGLDNIAGRALLMQRGVGGDHDEKTLLIARYSGNPLALKLVADTVDELFDGHIGEFLTEEILVFDDIRTVLDEHFARLSALEQDILFWLAVERESIPASSLAKSMVPHPTQRTFLEALRNLQRRSLIERSQSGFGLQNVIIEYLTDRLVESAVDELIHNKLNLLHRHPLLRTQAKEYIRQSQMRLILEPISRRLHRHWSSLSVAISLQQILADLRLMKPRRLGYAAGNILNLLKIMKEPITGYDFSGLAVWQADFVNFDLHHTNFSGTDLSFSAFTHDFGHIYCLVVQPQDELLAIGTGDGDVYLWQLADMQPRRVLYGHQNRVQGLAFHPSGELLASASYDSTVRLWHVESGRCLRILNHHSDGALTVDFSPDGTLLATGSRDRTVCLWIVEMLIDNDEERSAPFAVLKQHKDWVDAAAFAPNGKLLASGSEDATICLWDVDALLRQQSDQGQLDEGQLDEEQQGIKPIRSLVSPTISREDEGRVLTLAFSPDGSLLASGDVSGTVYLWDTQTWQVRHRCHGHANWIRALAFTPDGAIVASSGAETMVRLWDTATGRLVDTFYGHTRSVWTLGCTQDGTMLCSAGDDGSLRLWNLHNRGEHPAVGLVQGNPASIFAVAFHPEGNLLAASDEKGRIYLWDSPLTNPSACRTLVGHTGKVDAIAFHPDGKIPASVSNDETVRLWDWDNRCVCSLNVQAKHGLSQELTSVAFDPTGVYLAVGGTGGDIYLWHVGQPQQPRLHIVLQEHRSPIRKLSFSARGDILVSGSMDRTIRLWSLPALLEDQSASPVVIECPSEVWSMTLDSTGQVVVAACRDGVIRQWELHGFGVQPAQILFEQGESFQDVAVSPDNQLIATADGIDTITFWEMTAGHQRHVLRKHRQQIKSVAFRPDGEVIASGSLDGTINLWNVQTRAHLITLHPPGPYEGMNIADVTGISEAQRAMLKALGAVER
ncbi:MAG: WD40 repeat domain-containing protein [Caldilineaceae bacterium]